MTDTTLLSQCYNKGCGQKFDPAANGEDVCQYHPGEPVFHDATKKWSCCGKWSTDFTEFLNMKGCANGQHSDVKPVTENGTKKSDDSTIQMPPPRKMPEPISKKDAEQRPDENEPRVPLKVNVTSSAKSALEKKLAAMNIEQASATDGKCQSVIRPGAPCKHNGCKAVYNPETDGGKCCFHPGAPVFHEGCKFWSCCMIKRTDFTDFLAQPGCSNATHVWTTREDERRKRVDCRTDWFQTGNIVTINLYAKAPVPDKCHVTVNQVTVSVDVTFEGGESTFVKQFNLFGTIDPARSSVKLIGTKVEISLRKSDLAPWRSLEL